MFTPKKTIPKLAVAALAVTGCGGSDGNGGNGGDLTDSINAFCMKAVECFPGYTLQECTSYYNDLVAGYNLTPACKAAATSYFDCAAALSCAEIDMSSNSCDDEFDAIFDACEAL